MSRWFRAPLLFLLQMTLLHFKDADNQSTADTASMTLEMFRRQNLWQSTLFVCNKMDGAQLLRLIGKNVQTSVFFGTGNISESKLKSARARLGIVAFSGNDCVGKSEALLTLTKETLQNHKNSTYRWLLFGNSLEKTLSDLKNTRIELDTSLTVIVPVEGFSLDQNLFDIYQKDVNFISAYPVGHWQNKSMKNWFYAENAPHRKNMHKQPITYGLTVTRAKTWDNSKLKEILDLPRGNPNLPDQDSQLIAYHTIRITSEMFNYTLVGINGYKSPGYPQPNGTYTDLLGDMQKGEVYLSATNLLMLGHRLKVIRYLNFCFYFRNTMVYSSSNSFSTPTALIEPFSSGVWMVFGFYLLLSSALVTALFLYERRIRRRLLEISVREPMNLSSSSSSVLLLIMLVCGFVLHCAYSAVIVRFLLAEPSPNFLTLNDFMRDSLKISALDFFYYRNTVFGPNTSEVYREIYDKKMTSPGGFKGLHASVDGLLAGKWATFLPEPLFYEKVEKATPQQKCRIFEIPEIPKLQNPLCSMIYKQSPAINMFNRGITLLRERGFFSRNMHIWWTPKPSCEKSGVHQWGAISYKVLHPAFGLIGGGLLTSTLLLLLETVYFRWKCQEEKHCRWKLWASSNRRVDPAKNNDATIFQTA